MKSIRIKFEEMGERRNEPKRRMKIFLRKREKKRERERLNSAKNNKSNREK